jgi:small GTP-binding protein
MTIEEQIKAVEKEIKDTPYDKSTERHHGMLRAKLSRLKERQEVSQSRSSGGGGGYAVKKQGDATVVLVGPPSAGKSTLLNLLTNAQSKVAPYAFTTVTVIPGMLLYNEAYIQILDVPGLIEGAETGKGRGREVLSVVRGADLMIIMTDPKRMKAFDSITQGLEEAGIRINKKRPDVIVDMKLNGGLNIVTNVGQELDKETVREVANEFGIKNADIRLREELNIETLTDAFANNRVYTKALYVVNKAEHVKKRDPKFFYISAVDGKGVDLLKKAIWEKLNLCKIYLIKPGEEPGEKNAMIVKSGDTLEQVAKNIGSEFFEGKTGAKIWGNGSKFPGQEVSLKMQIVEGMQVRFV